MSTSADSPLPIEPAPAATAQSMRRRQRLMRWMLVAFALGLVVSLVLAWSGYQRMRRIEQELARRLQDTQSQSSEARMVARQSQELSRETAAKLALLDARLAEVAMQRTQLEELIQSLSHSRDENLVVDIDAGLRVAQQQSVITGSAEPLMTALRQADERLARHSQPRLDPVRRAVARDMDRVKAVGMADISALGIKLDEAVRLVDELPMLHQPLSRQESAGAPAVPARPARPGTGAGSTVAGWWDALADGWSQGVDTVWNEVRSLVRITRIDHPDAVLLAPEQAFFVRENLKLRLLNARLALLSRQFDTAQSDLQSAQAMLERYFDRNSRRTAMATDLVKQVTAEGRQSVLPRPDETLAALSAVAGGR